MRPSTRLALVLAFPVIALAAPADDLASLRTACISTANVINNATMNGTMMLNTSSLVMSIVYEVGASEANLSNGTLSNNTSAAFNGTSGYLDNDYFDYVDELGTLSTAIQQRGQMRHTEMSLAVYTAIQGLASAVSSYGQKLRTDNLISQNATIRTITASFGIVQAASPWASNLYYPSTDMAKRVPVSPTEEQARRAAF